VTLHDVAAHHAGGTDNAFFGSDDCDVLHGIVDNAKSGGLSRHDRGLLLNGGAEHPRHLEPVAEAAGAQCLLALANVSRNRDSL
jgi:hypothetical protein